MNAEQRRKEGLPPYPEGYGDPSPIEPMAERTSLPMTDALPASLAPLLSNPALLKTFFSLLTPAANTPAPTSPPASTPADLASAAKALTEALRPFLSSEKNALLDRVLQVVSLSLGKA